MSADIYKLIQAANRGGPRGLIAQLGVNHNGSLNLATKLIEGAKASGCDAVQFSKHFPSSFNDWERERLYDSPSGPMSAVEFYQHTDFGLQEFSRLIQVCEKLNLAWFPMVNDEASLDFFETFNPALVQLDSRRIRAERLITRLRQLGKPVVLTSYTGSDAGLENACDQLGRKVMIAHSTKNLATPADQLFLQRIPRLRAQFPLTPIGYMGREVGLPPTTAAISLGASFIERQITLDRAAWGPEQAASVEITNMKKLVAQIREIEQSLHEPMAHPTFNYEDSWAYAATVH